MKQPTFSVILPIYNQEKQIKFLIENYTKALDSLKQSYELLLIVNGSKDKSYELAKKYSDKSSSIKVYNLEKGGWGRAVKYGLEAAKGDYVCYTNSARTDINDLINILQFAQVNNTYVVKASRIIRESFRRKLGSVIYNLECRLLFHTPIWDVNGTPKVLPRKVLEKMQLISENDLIDAELMARCRKMHIPVVEVSVLLTKRIEGKSTTSFKSAYNMYKGLFQLRNKI